ncbi:GNAT family N-acetyltransferase [Amycolatopsis sp. NBC_00438]|uniref:GNAT family N-acetyltransferase n=1 Tax=Amycolatopsis sp. NBC_00438 TaxID=2903558 RepID=UPI002E1EA22C
MERVGRVQPVVAEALESAEPVAVDTAGRVRPVATEVLESAQPGAAEGVGQAQPVAMERVGRVQPVVAEGLESAEPVAADTAGRAQPVVAEEPETARRVVAEGPGSARAVVAEALEWARPVVAEERESARLGVAETPGAAQAVATMTLHDEPPEGFWLAEDDPSAALYLSHLAVDRRFAGRGVGTWLLDEAEREAVRRGKVWLRLDAWKTNTRLHAYYLRHGFRPVRIADVPGRGSGALFQRPVAGCSR